MRHFGETTWLDALMDMASGPYRLNVAAGMRSDGKRRAYRQDWGYTGPGDCRSIPARGSREYQEAMERFKRMTGE